MRYDSYEEVVILYCTVYSLSSTVPKLGSIPMVVIRVLLIYIYYCIYRYMISSDFISFSPPHACKLWVGLSLLEVFFLSACTYSSILSYCSIIIIILYSMYYIDIRIFLYTVICTTCSIYIQHIHIYIYIHLFILY